MGISKDQRYLVRDGEMDDKANVILVENNGVRLVAANLGTAVPVQVLAGDNYRTAKAADWTQFYDPHGNAVALSAERPYVQLVHGGIYRLDPRMAEASGGSVFMEDDEYLSEERVRFVYDQYGGNVMQAAQAAAANEAAAANTQLLVDAINALQLALTPTPTTELVFISSEQQDNLRETTQLTVPADATEADIQNISNKTIVYAYDAGATTKNYLLPGQHMRVVGHTLLTNMVFTGVFPPTTIVEGGGAGTEDVTSPSFTANYFKRV